MCNAPLVEVNKETVWPPMLLNLKQAAHELGVSKSTLFALMRAGEISSVLLGPQIRRIPRTEIEAFIERKLREQAADGAA
jgi:excisionase family DNA binding protein